MKRQLRSVGTAFAWLVAAGMGAVALTGGAASAWAQQSPVQPLLVTANKATIVRLAGQAQNVIIGDPRVVDITVETRSMLVLFGRAPGETNLIVLDSQNREILSVPVVVATEKDRHVSVVSAGKTGYAEVVYNCAERCVQVAQQGTPAAASGGGQGPVPEGTPASPPAAAPAQAPGQTPAEAPAKTPGGGAYKR